MLERYPPLNLRIFFHPDLLLYYLVSSEEGQNRSACKMLMQTSNVISHAQISGVKQ